VGIPPRWYEGGRAIGKTVEVLSGVCVLSCVDRLPCWWPVVEGLFMWELGRRCACVVVCVEPCHSLTVEEATSEHLWRLKGRCWEA